MDLWVLSHPDLRRVAPVRTVTEFIVDCITADRDLFESRRPGSPQPLEPPAKQRAQSGPTAASAHHHWMAGFEALFSGSLVLLCQ